MMRREEWEVVGFGGETVFGVSEWVAETPTASVTLSHGLKGFSGYGFLPVLAARLAAVLPVVVHRYNGSHSGMTRDESVFARPDLFGRETWDSVVCDVRAVTRAARVGELPGTRAGRRVINAGHSRGGTGCLLSAGRDGASAEKADGVVSVSAPSWCCRDVAGTREVLDAQGYLDMTSARTGQVLRTERVWLERQLADPAGHDVLRLCERISVPLLVVHGEADETVPVSCGREIASAARGGALVVIAGCDHVMNTAHPADVGGDMSAALGELVGAVVSFVERVMV